MKYTPSALVSEFSGAQGSTVASHNRFGPYFRNRTIPVNPNSVEQQVERNNLAAYAAAWRGLTDAERVAWNAAAQSVTLYDRLGRPYNPTGQQYFISVNRTQFVYSGSATVQTALPSATPVTAPATITPDPKDGAATFTVAYTATPLPASTKALIECTRQLSQGINFVSRSEYRAIFVTAAAAASPADIHAAYIAKFGALVADNKIFTRVTFIASDGRRSQPLSSSAIVAA